MPQFYFNYRKASGDIDRDDQGIELADFETAYLEAYRAAIDMFAEARRAGLSLDFDSIEVCDASNRSLLDLTIEEVIGHLSPPPQPRRDNLVGIGTHIAHGSQRIADQRVRVSRLEAIGSDAHVNLAKRLLATMLDSQRHLDWAKHL